MPCHEGIQAALWTGPQGKELGPAPTAMWVSHFESRFQAWSSLHMTTASTNNFTKNLMILVKKTQNHVDNLLPDF